MSSQAVPRKTQRHILDIPAAAYQAGYSSRHFRRIIEEDHIPVLRIGQKYFITAHDLETWKSTHGNARFEECLKQLDRWLTEDSRRTVVPAEDLDDDD